MGSIQTSLFFCSPSGREVRRAPVKLKYLFGFFFHSKSMSNLYTGISPNFCVTQFPSEQWFSECSDEDEREGVLVTAPPRW